MFNGGEDRVDENELVGNAPDLSDPNVQNEIRARYTEKMDGEHGENGRMHALEDLADEYKTTVEEIERIVPVQ